MKSHSTEGTPPTSISQMMTPGIIQVPGDITVAKAAFLMQKEQAPCLLVKDSDARVGIMTYTDIVKKVVAQGLEPQDVQVRSIMSRPVQTIDYDRPLDEASTMMATTGVALLVVTKDQQPVGIVRARDLVYVAKHCTVRIPAVVTLIDSKADGSKHQATMTQVSHLAATVECPLMLPQGTQVMLGFTLPDTSDFITVYGKVAVASDEETPQAARGLLFTVQFTHLNASDQTRIRNWVSRQSVSES